MEIFELLMYSCYNKKLFSGFNKDKKVWVVIKEQIILDNELLNIV